MYITHTTRQKQIEEIIQLNNSNLSKMLNVELFMQYCREADPIAIDFISKNVKQMLDILFVDYDKVSVSMYETYSDLNSKIWEILDLNLELIYKQIEIYWEVIFDLRWRAQVPDTQWGMAQKLFLLIKERDKKFVQDQFSRPNFLISFLPLMHINSVAQIVIIFFEFGFHQQQIDFLKSGVEKFPTFEPCTAINFTFIIHEIMVRIMSQEHIDFLLKKDVLKKMLIVIQREDINPITLKNAAHVLSLISNYYSADMQNISLDEAETQEITDSFRSTEFFEAFDMKVITSIFNRNLQQNTKLGLLIIKLVEIVDNLIRITDIQLWERIEKANIMDPMLGLVRKFNKADIFISYVNNMISFIFDRALNDFHPYWAHKLIINHKIQKMRLRSVDRLIYSFEQKLSLKLIKDGDFLPYFDYLKKIEEELMVSHSWRNIKIQLMKQEERHKNKLGDDLSSPQIEENIIVSALDVEDEKFQEQDAIEEPENNIFIQCQRRSSNPQHLELKQNLFETIPITVDSESDIDPIQNEQNEQSEQSSEQCGNNGTDPLDHLKNVLQDMDIHRKENKMTQSDSLDDYKKQKKTRILSNSLNENEHQNQKIVKSMSSSLKQDQDFPQLGLQRRSSLQSSLGIKKMNKTFEEFHIDVLNNRKILKNDDNTILKVDEIDLEKEPPSQLLQVVFQKSEDEIVLKTKVVSKNEINPNKVQNMEDIKFRQMTQKDYHFLQFLNEQG